MAHSFSISEALERGWHLMRIHSGLIFQMMLTFFALEVVSAIVNRTLQGTIIGFLAAVALGLVGVFIGTGMTLISLRLAKGEHVHYQDLFPNWLLVLKFMCANILAGLIMFVPLLIGALVAFALGMGSIFLAAGPSMPMGASAAGLAAACIVFLAAFLLAVYFVIRYSLVRFAVLDGASITDSLRRSASCTRGVKWHLLLFLLVIILINIIGALLLLVGLLVTLPVSMLAYAHIYLKLKTHHGQAH